MKIMLMIFILINILNAKSLLQIQLDDLLIASEDYPPISFKNKNGKADGLASDVAYAIMKQLKMTQEIHIWPWARDYKLLKKGPNYLVFSVARTKERDKLFQWVGPIYSMNTGFYTKKDSLIKINSLDDAKKLHKIGTYFESFDEQYLENKHFLNLESTRNNILNIKKMMIGRFDVITATNVTIKSMVQKAGYSMNDIKNTYTFMSTGVYFAFSQDVPFKVVDAWRKELENLRNSGKLQQIREKWLK